MILAKFHSETTFLRFLAKEALQEADQMLQKVISEHDSDKGIDSDQDSGANVRNRAANASKLAES